MPETNFPEPPDNRWTNWSGDLEPGDENYIFTRSVYIDLFERIFRKARKFGYSHEQSEDIANEVIERCFEKMKYLCYMRTKIVKSISSLCWAWVHIYFNNSISKELHIKETGEPLNPVYIQKEYIDDIRACIQKLEAEEERIITKYYFEDLTLEEIATEEKLTLNQVFSRKEQIERKLYHCMKDMGY